jgi:hypothetical protein
MWRLGLGLLLSLGPGCGLLIDFAGEGEAPPDGAPLDAPNDAGVSADGGVADAGRGEAGADAAMTFDPCDPAVLAEGVIAAYEFENNHGDSAGLGAPEADRAPNAEAMTWFPGPCGTALGFDGVNYAVIPHWERWHEVKSVDFLLYAPTAPPGQTPRGVLSRDGNTNGSGGHITVGRSSTDRITVRLQSDSETLDEDKRCSRRLDLGDWVHVGINVGDGALVSGPELELWVNGEPFDERGVDRTLENLANLGCSDHTPLGLPSVTPNLCCTTAPWVLGAANMESPEGTLDRLEAPLPDGGAMDRLRFSTVRRDFSRVAR